MRLVCSGWILRQRLFGLEFSAFFFMLQQIVNPELHGMQPHELATPGRLCSVLTCASACTSATSAERRNVVPVRGGKCTRAGGAS